MGNRAEAFFLVDPYFDRAEWLEKEKMCIRDSHGGAPDSIAGERENKHTADGVPA